MTSTPQFVFFDDPLMYFNSMLADINSASSYIYIQTYKFTNDAIGVRFRDALIKKAKAGLEVKIIIDSWGGGAPQSFFDDLLKAGGEVVFFKRLKFGLGLIAKNHKRNHRKLLIIDDIISYIGSANITGYSLTWRESVLKLNGEISKIFKSIFLDDYKLSKKYFPNKRYYTKPIKFEDFSIIRDVPGNIVQKTRRFFLNQIKNAEEEIIIETPYFLPGSIIRKQLINASNRGVKITIITPKHSDLSVFDTLRNKYLGLLFKNNIDIYLYQPYNLHAKVFLVDGKTFCIGSSNFDYRSFRFQHEINLAGTDTFIIENLKNHLKESIQDCVLFDFEEWTNRPLILKFIEWLLVPIRHFF